MVAAVKALALHSRVAIRTCAHVPAHPCCPQLFVHRVILAAHVRRVVTRPAVPARLASALVDIRTVGPVVAISAHAYSVLTAPVLAARNFVTHVWPQTLAVYAAGARTAAYRHGVQTSVGRHIARCATISVRAVAHTAYAHPSRRRAIHRGSAAPLLPLGNRARRKKNPQQNPRSHPSPTPHNHGPAA